MAKKGSITEASPMSWDQLQNLLARMEKDVTELNSHHKREQHIKFLLLIALGVYAGLRIGDILSFSWIDILDKDSILVIEEKRKKRRPITLNQSLIKIIRKCFLLINPDPASLIFTNSNALSKKVMSVQYINRKLKIIFRHYKVKVPNVSSHTLRKTFGRRVFELNSRSDEALIRLSTMFNHANTAITRRYIGIQAETIADIYLNL